MQSAHYRGAQGIILGSFSGVSYYNADPVTAVYDTSCRKSFEDLTRWFAEIETYTSRPVVKVIVGNKVDKACPLIASHDGSTLLIRISQEFQRQVPTMEAAAFAEMMGYHFFETSAKTAVGVRRLFRDMVERIIEKPELHVVSKPSPPQASFARPLATMFFSC
jgi:Ras-related protein Rab-18